MCLYIRFDYPTRQKALLRPARGGVARWAPAILPAVKVTRFRGHPEVRDNPQGTCALGKSCKFGRVSVELEDVAELERKQREEDAHFAAMSATEHIEAARWLMAEGYDAKTRFGGRLDEAEKHLNAASGGGGPPPASTQMLKEIAERRKRENQFVEKATAEMMRSMRATYAQNMDSAFIRTGVEVNKVMVTGDHGTTLHIDYALCGRAFIDRVAGEADTQRALRKLGFRRIECSSGLESAWLTLASDAGD